MYEYKGYEIDLVYLCAANGYVMWWSYVCGSGGYSATEERKTLCLSLAPRPPVVYCRLSSPLGTEAALVRASGFRGAVGSFLCGH
jgi:hypothetical protein